MTNDYITQLPGEVNIEMTEDNDLIFAVAWDVDISTYTFTANIIPKSCENEIPMGITIINPTLGTMNVTISASSIVDLAPSTNKWYMNWTVGGLSRTVLAGALVLRSR